MDRSQFEKLVIWTVIILAIGLAIFFYFWHAQQNQLAAGDAMTQAMFSTSAPNTTPAQVAQTYLQIADDYSGTPAGGRALIQGAITLFTEGKYTDAQDHFQRYLDAHPDDPLSGLAELGVAKCLEAEGKLNDAQGAYQHVINDFTDEQAVNTARFSMARVDALQGHYKDALSLYQQVFQNDPYGSLGGEARQNAYEIESKMPAQSAPSTVAPERAPAMAPVPAHSASPKTPARSLNLNQKH